MNTFPILNICLSFKSFHSTVSYGDFLAHEAAASAALLHISIEQDISQLPPHSWVPLYSAHLTCMHFFILSIKCPRENRKVFMFFSLFCPEFFFSLKVDSKIFSLPSDHSIITGEFKVLVFQNCITMMHFIRHWLTICS